MKASLKWLRDFINLDLSPEEISEILTDIGLEVEKQMEVESIKGGLRGLVIGEVLTVEKHPDADRLNITTVNIGAAEPSQIVCGAPNVAVGQKVVVAVPGAILYPSEGDSFKIKASKIRGVASLGMICAEDEIGLGKGHDGIMVLDTNAKAGTEAAKYFDVETDIVYEIGLTPNRADAMGQYGVARDLMVALKHKKLLPQDTQVCRHSIDKFEVTNTNESIDVSVENGAACPRYMGVTISGIKVAESPKWIKERLEAIGLSPINNVVDATNYVLHEMGQPLHAFDANVVGKKLIVKTLPDNTKFTTLDDVERKLHHEDLMICNEEGGMCIAGVFGGKASGVSEDTTSIFLESAYFNPVSVRKTAKRHALNTDASFRFERGVDFEMVPYALKRAALLIMEIAGGEISSKVTDIQSSRIENFIFEIDLNRINKLIGVDVPKEEALSILESLEIDVLENNYPIYKIEVPSYRVDVTREVDIAEEILRIVGFNNVPLPKKLNTSISKRPTIDKEKIQHMIADLLVSKGFSESISNSLTKSAYAKEMGTKSVQEGFNVRMLNPLSIDLDVMRQTLLFGALEAIKLNQNFGTDRIKMFEFGKTYQKFESGFTETKYLSIVMSGNRTTESWNAAKGDVSFYTIKGVLETIFNKLGILKNYQIIGTKNEFLADGLTYTIAKKTVAHVGWITKEIKNKFGIKKDVFFAEINWDEVINLLRMNKVKFKELVKYPAVTRDLSLLLDTQVTFSDLATASSKTDRKLLKEVSLFDVYEGKNLPEGKKSYALRFVIQDENKTLKDKEIDKVMNKIQSTLENEFNAELR